MKVFVKKTNKDAVIPFKTYKRDFCYDVVATSCEEVAPNVYKYGLGIAMQIEVPWNYVDTDYVLSFELRPRSSIWKTGMVLSNSFGTIDEGFNSEISAVFYHVMPNMPKYEVGQKVGQICIMVTPMIEFEEVKKLKETDRGGGAYGSTGK